MPSLPPRVVGLPAAAMLLLGACTVPPAGSDARPSTSASPAVPPDLVVLFGRTGAPAGHVQGHSLRADGSLLRWEGRSPEQNVLARAVLPPDSVRRLWRRIEAAGVMDSARQDARMPAYFLNVTAGGRARRVSWHTPLGMALPATPLQALYDTLDAAATRALARAS